MRITITVEEMIKAFDIALHGVSLFAGAIIAMLILRAFPYMYIGKALLIYACVIVAVYIPARFVLCKIFKPFIRRMS